MLIGHCLGQGGQELPYLPVTEVVTRVQRAAPEVFAEVGMDAASVEMICERAGFTRGAFYSNFASMDELLVAVNQTGAAA